MLQKRIFRNPDKNPVTPCKDPLLYDTLAALSKSKEFYEHTDWAAFENLLIVAGWRGSCGESVGFGRAW